VAGLLPAPACRGPFKGFALALPLLLVFNFGIFGNSGDFGNLSRRAVDFLIRVSSR